MDVYGDPYFSELSQPEEIPDEMEKSFSAPTRAFIRNRKAMAAMKADIRELPEAYEFIVDMPGMNCGDIKVHLEDGRLLVVSGERRREEAEEAKYLRIERRMGKLTRRFRLRKKVKPDAISAKFRDGVLIVTVKKPPVPEEKKPKTIEVNVG